MYHIIQYFKSYSRVSLKDNRLIAGKDRKVFKSIRRDTKWLLLAIGIIEIIPVLIGLGLSLTIEKSVFRFDYLLFGIIATTLLIFIFKRKTPDIPIKLNRLS
jgi:undecaprenyl pyrophosphate phosphatase UppP